MSFRTVNENRVGSKTLSSNENDLAPDWVRNPSWLPLPSVTGLQKMVGLHAVFPDANFLSLTCSGNYTVDWGDGTTENVATGVQAYHEYDFNDADIANTDAPVTLQDSGDTVTRTAHGYTDGMTVMFYNLVSTTGISVNTTYYVVNATANTFQVAATLGGSPLTLTTDGTATLLPYKQVIVQVTGNGANLTSINLYKLHSKVGLTALYASGWLDIAIEGANLTTLVVGNSGISGVVHSLLEQFSLTGTTSITTATALFYWCRNLQSVPSLALGNVTSTSTMFSWCYKLKKAPMFNTASCTDFYQMFDACANLIDVPNYVTTAGTNFSSMFAGCASLTRVPYINTAGATNANGVASMFSGCSSLKEVPLLNTASVTNFSGMFNGCAALETVPPMNTAAGTNFSSTFYGCSRLKEIPLLNTANGTNFGSMFYNCTALKTIPAIDTAKGTAFGSMFYGCKSLKSVPLLNTALCVTTGFQSMFQGCTALETVPLFNTAGGVNFTSMFNGCNNLRTVPLFNLGSATTLTSMFAGCFNLESLPDFNTVNVTAFNNFSNLIGNQGMALHTFPALNMGSSTNNGAIWYNCPSVQRFKAYGIKSTISLSSAKLSVTALNEVFMNLGVGTSQTITISSNYGALTPVSVSNCNGTAGNASITLTNTTGINIGDQVTGTGTNTTTAFAVPMNTNTIGIGNTYYSNGDIVAFSSLPAGCANLSVYTLYYIVNATGSSVQVAATPNGTPITFSGAGSNAFIRSGQFVTAITPNTSVTVSRNGNNISSATLSFRPLKTYLALIKNWTVTG